MLQHFDDPERLLEACGPCLSIYCPTAHTAPESDGARVQAKNLIRDAEKELTAHGMRAPEARALVAPLEKIMGDLGARNDGVESIAAFAAPGRAYHQELPYRCPPSMRVGPRFHLTPLMPWLVEDRRFELLVLAQKHVRFYRGNRSGLEEIDVPGLPESLEDALGYEVSEQSLQFHTGAAAGARGRPQIVHGQGRGDGEDRKADVQRFCRQVDEALAHRRSDPHVPLIVAAVEYVFHIFQAVTRIDAVQEAYLRGNCDHLSVQQLHAQAAALVERRVQAERQRDQEQLPVALAHERGAQDLRDIVAAATDGRVETLFAAVDGEAWGRVTENRQVELRDKAAHEAEDLVNYAVASTYACDGRVHVVPREEMPVDATLAAIYRY